MELVDFYPGFRAPEVLQTATDFTAIKYRTNRRKVRKKR